MRLLNTTTLQFLESYKPPKYAILSHRWRDEEVGYEDFDLTLQPQDLVPPWLVPKIEDTKSRAGYQKILDFARVANESGYEWCWVDTCCIDKRSSAELSEAINSMWTWYKKAKLCIVYLDDVAPGSHKGMSAAFIKSEWFRRCWTLQELLAPTSIRFCTSTWRPFMRLRKASNIFLIGAKAARFEDDGDDRAPAPEPDAMHLLVQASGVPLLGLSHYRGPRMISIATRMSWASGRDATRVEDVAYSLLGLFGINMPLLYGEGENAFNRLQQEIIRSSADESIFAWRSLCDSCCELDGRFSRCCLSTTLLARSPAAFRHSGDIDRLYRDVRTPEESEGPVIEDESVRTRPTTLSITNQSVTLKPKAFLTRRPGTSAVMVEQEDRPFKEVAKTPGTHCYYIVYLRCYDTKQGKQCVLVLDADETNLEYSGMALSPILVPLYRHYGSPIDVLWRVQSCSLHFSPFAKDYDGLFTLDFGIQDMDVTLYAHIGTVEEDDDLGDSDQKAALSSSL
ncbi:hypothetical protein LTR86_006114 [Recurvomyces mirabilis]|nr:hypothetical protein LTR86_006114 [Recurvomyces mirabilis]